MQGHRRSGNSGSVSDGLRVAAGGPRARTQVGCSSLRHFLVDLTVWYDVDSVTSAYCEFVWRG